MLSLFAGCVCAWYECKAVSSTFLALFNFFSIFCWIIAWSPLQSFVIFLLTNRSIISAIFVDQQKIKEKRGKSPSSDKDKIRIPQRFMVYWYWLKDWWNMQYASQIRIYMLLYLFFFVHILSRLRRIVSKTIAHAVLLQSTRFFARSPGCPLVGIHSIYSVHALNEYGR